jgi:hypothetical protein
MISLEEWPSLDPNALWIIAIALITAGACGLTAVAFLAHDALKQRRADIGSSAAHPRPE